MIKQFIENQQIENRVKMIKPTDSLCSVASVQSVLRAVLTV